jgi:hypothetical protein
MRLAAFALMFLTAISTFKEGYGFWDIYRREAVGTTAWRVYLLARFVGASQPYLRHMEPEHLLLSPEGRSF